MSAPDPESVGLFAKVMTGAAAVITPLYGCVKYLDGRFEKKADKSEVERHRDYFVKVFDKLEEHQKSDSEHFEKLTNIMHTNHAEILRALGSKADR